MLGFGAGVMLAATAFSLVIPGLDAARALWGDPWIAGGVMVAGIVAGGGALLWLDGRVPHAHFLNGADGVDTEALARVWLFVFAIALHNLPEGLAIGVAAAREGAGAAALAMGIAIQDIPEGLVVALALRGAGYRASTAALVGAASGLVEPVAAVLGASLIQVSAVALPWGLALAAGAMLLVVSHEIIPESHRSGHEGAASKGLLIGFCVMMLLDTALA
ncbi:MAG: ZIP family metal transporter [Rhodocyclaceae bacterium]